MQYMLVVKYFTYLQVHSGRYGHNNETLILQNFAFIMQFYTYFKLKSLTPDDIIRSLKMVLSY